jgi:tetratricopeptide (TPR) repeat protein
VQLGTVQVDMGEVARRFAGEFTTAWSAGEKFCSGHRAARSELTDEVVQSARTSEVAAFVHSDSSRFTRCGVFDWLSHVAHVPSSEWQAAFDRGRELGATSDYAGAEAAFREAIALAPGEPHPHYELGYALCSAGRYEDALVEFRLTDRLSPGLLLVQTDIYLCEQMVSRTIDGTVLEMLRQLQWISDSGGASSKEAQALSRRVVQRAPTCALAFYFLGKSLIEAMPDASEIALQRCLELAPDSTTAINARFHVGLLREHAGKRDEARQIWQQILVEFPGHLHAEVARKLAGL